MLTSSDDNTATKAAPLKGEDRGGAQKKGFCPALFSSRDEYSGFGNHYRRRSKSAIESIEGADYRAQLRGKRFAYGSRFSYPPHAHHFFTIRTWCKSSCCAVTPRSEPCRLLMQHHRPLIDATRFTLLEHGQIIICSIVLCVCRSRYAQQVGSIGRER